MRYLPSIPDEVLSANLRARIYALEMSIDAMDPKLLAPRYKHMLLMVKEVLAAFDSLCLSWADVAQERDKWKGICDLASDDQFWKALELLRGVQCET